MIYKWTLDRIRIDGKGKLRSHVTTTVININVTVEKTLTNIINETISWHDI